MDTVLGLAELLLVPVAVASTVLLLIGRLLPIGLPSRIWIGTYVVVLGLGWLTLIAYWLYFFGIEPDDHARGEAFLVGALLSLIMFPVTVATVAGSLWRHRTG